MPIERPELRNLARWFALVENREAAMAYLADKYP